MIIQKLNTQREHMNKHTKLRGDVLTELEIVAEKLQWRICKVIDNCQGSIGKELSQINDKELLEALKKTKRDI